MALSDPQSYYGDGSTRDFTILGEIPSESHLRVWIDDVIQSSDDWDLLGNTVLFNTAPAEGEAIQFIISSTGADFPQNPTNMSNVALNIEKVVGVAENINSVNAVADIGTQVNTVSENVADIETVANNIDDVNTVASISTEVPVVANISDEVKVLSDTITEDAQALLDTYVSGASPEIGYKLSTISLVLTLKDGSQVTVTDTNGDGLQTFQETIDRFNTSLESYGVYVSYYYNEGYSGPYGGAPSKTYFYLNLLDSRDITVTSATFNYIILNGSFNSNIVSPIRWNNLDALNINATNIDSINTTATISDEIATIGNDAELITDIKTAEENATSASSSASSASSSASEASDSATASSNSATASASSATDSLAYAQASATSADEADGYKQGAYVARQDAIDAADNALTRYNDTVNYSDNALVNMQTAQEAAINASVSATQSSIDAQTAEDGAEDARDIAVDAKNTAVNASTDAINAKEVIESYVVPTEATYTFSTIDDKDNLQNQAIFAQHGLIPNDGVNEIRPQDLFVEVNTPNIVAVPEEICRNWKVRFTDGVYSLDHLLETIA